MSTGEGEPTMSPTEFAKEAARIIRVLQDRCWARTKKAVETAMGVTNGGVETGTPVTCRSSDHPHPYNPAHCDSAEVAHG